MAHEHSDLRTWIGRLRDGDAVETTRDADDLDRDALDSAVGFAAEHARRYVATGGADDGWDGPRPIVLLYTTGRRSGKVRRNPLLCFERDGERYVIGSKGGAERAPAWYLNLTAEARVHVRFGPDLYEADAVTIDDDERAALWPELVARYPMFGDYQRTTTRQIPLVRLVRRGADDFAALEQLAAGMRRLNRAVAGRHATDDDLRSLARRVAALAEQLEAGAVRPKDEAMALALGIDHALAPPPPPAVGEVVEFDPFGLGGGRLNPASIDLAFVRDGDESVVATATIDGMFQGPPSRVHGGVVALVFDELMGAVNRVTGRRAFTARLTVNLRAAAPIDTELTFRAWIDQVEGRKITIRGEGRSADGLFADADGLFVTMAELPEG